MITYLLPCPTFDTPFTTRLIWHDEADHIFYTTIPLFFSAITIYRISQRAFGVKSAQLECGRMLGNKGFLFLYWGRHVCGVAHALADGVGMGSEPIEWLFGECRWENLIVGVALMYAPASDDMNAAPISGGRCSHRVCFAITHRPTRRDMFCYRSRLLARIEAVGRKVLTGRVMERLGFERKGVRQALMLLCMSERASKQAYLTFKPVVWQKLHMGGKMYAQTIVVLRNVLGPRAVFAFSPWPICDTCMGFSVQGSCRCPCRSVSECKSQESGHYRFTKCTCWTFYSPCANHAYLPPPTSYMLYRS